MRHARGSVIRPCKPADALDGGQVQRRGGESAEGARAWRGEATPPHAPRSPPSPLGRRPPRRRSCPRTTASECQPPARRGGRRRCRRCAGRAGLQPGKQGGRGSAARRWIQQQQAWAAHHMQTVFKPRAGQTAWLWRRRGPGKLVLCQCNSWRVMVMQASHPAATLTGGGTGAGRGGSGARWRGGEVVEERVAVCRRRGRHDAAQSLPGRRG